MDAPRRSGSARDHDRNRPGPKVARPRTSTTDPLDADDPLSAQTARLSISSRNASPRTSTSLRHSPSASPARPSSLQRQQPANVTKDFAFLLKPEIYHQLSPLNIPAPFRNPAKQPSPEMPLSELLAAGHFRGAAIAAAQALTSNPASATMAAAHPPVDPTDAAQIFELLYIRLACLCLADATTLAAQESKALEDLNSGFYHDAVTGAHLAPWELRVLVVRLQTIGFGDPRRAVMSYHELARESRARAAAAARAHDHSASELWKRRLAHLGIKVAGALVEMNDLAGAAEHLATLKDHAGDGRLAMSRALLWLHLGDVGAALRCFRDDEATGSAQKIISALASMADGEYEAALPQWQALHEEMEEAETTDEMIGVNLAVCLLYVGRMEEGRGILEDLVDDGLASHTLLFNLTTMYELCTDKAKNLKTQLTERVAEKGSKSQAAERTNADFKL